MKHHNYRAMVCSSLKLLIYVFFRSLDSYNMDWVLVLSDDKILLLRRLYNLYLVIMCVVKCVEVESRQYAYNECILIYV
jgi:hypothetical protein